MAGEYDNSEPYEYCVVHDQPMDWCKDPDRCREIMTGWGLYTDKGLTRLPSLPVLEYGEAPE